MKYVYFVSCRFSNMDVHFDCMMTSNLMIADDTRLKEIREHIFNTLSDSKEKVNSNASDCPLFVTSSS